MLTEEQRNKLLDKRDYYSKHPEESRATYVKKHDGIGLIPLKKAEKKSEK